MLGLAGFSDEIFFHVFPHLSTPALYPAPLTFTVLLWALGAATIVLSIPPVLNLFSRQQRMNYSYNRYHLVNTYGAFGSVTRERYEIVLEGASDRVPTSATVWREYGFKGKPGDLYRMPRQVAPYHLRLDWMIWFLPFTVGVTNRGIRVPSYEIWFLRLVKQLLVNDTSLLKLMGMNPFSDKPPDSIRARFYRYRYTDRATKQATGAWWSRELLGEYLEPVNLQSLDGI
ncbi:MAG: lipase maturation factor family protein [Janthinobacterium lividum]